MLLEVGNYKKKKKAWMAVVQVSLIEKFPLLTSAHCSRIIFCPVFIYLSLQQSFIANNIRVWRENQAENVYNLIFKC